ATVIDEKRAQAKAVTVLLIPEAAKRRNYSLYFRAVTDGDGKAKIENIPPGNYEAVAMETAEEGSWWDPAFLDRIEGQAKAVRIEAGKAVNLELRAIR